MKKLLVAMTLLAASTSMAKMYSSNDSINGPNEFISWCEYNNVMFFEGDEVKVLQNCTEQNKTCTVVQIYSGFRTKTAGYCATPSTNE